MPYRCVRNHTDNLALLRNKATVAREINLLLEERALGMLLDDELEAKRVEMESLRGGATQIEAVATGSTYQ
jgi:hypothetical protein